MQAPRSIKSSRYPEFIRTNEVLHKFAGQEKIFPKIGLKNCSAAFSLGDYETAAMKEYVEELRIFLINKIQRNLVEEMENLQFGNGFPLDLFTQALPILIDHMKKDPLSFVAKNSRTIGLKLPFDIAGPFEKAAYYKGDDLFDTLRSLTDRSSAHLPEINSLFGEFNSFKKLLNRKDLRIVFSGNGSKGAWDMATMSMRGIKSCQKWTNAHSKSLVGSIIDPYAAVIYITDGRELSHGTNMIRRSVVRFVINRRTKKPEIFLERPYPHDYDSGIEDVISINAFANLINRKTDNKFRILCGNGKRIFIPITKPVNELRLYTSSHSMNPDRFLSYRDSGVKYAKSAKYQDVSKLYAR